MRGVSLNTPNAEQNKGEKEMTQSKTKKALLMSVLSMVLCVAMLVGMTFAWFTDTASTGVNKIQAGRLDVALEKWNGEKWVNAENQTLNFVKAKGHESEEILWEPGCTYELPKLRVVNNGNLALKYKIQVTGIKANVTTTTGSDLNEAIEWTMKLNGEDFVMGSDHNLSAKTGDTVSAHEFTIKGHMKESAGNEYQGLTIDGIAITVVATQLASEFDSIGNDYDALAEYPVYAFGTVEKDENNRSTKEITISSLKTSVETELPMAKATVPKGSKIDADATGLKLIIESAKNPEGITINATQIEPKTLDISMKGLAADNDKLIKVEFYIEKGLSLLEINHNGRSMSRCTALKWVDEDQEFYYDSTTGLVTMLTKTFSPFTYTADKFQWDNKKAQEYKTPVDTANKVITVNSAEEMALFKYEITDEKVDYDGYTLNITSDIDLGLGFWRPIDPIKNMTINGNGHTISNLVVRSCTNNGGYGFGFIGNARGKVKIHDLTFNNANVAYAKYGQYTGNVGAVVLAYAYGTTEFDNVRVVDSQIEGYGKIGMLLGMGADPGVKVTFKDCASKNNTIRAVYNIGGLAGNIQRKDGNDNGEVENCTVENINVIYDSRESYVDVEDIATMKSNDQSNGTDMEKKIVGKFWIKDGYYWGGYADYYVSYGYTSYDAPLKEGNYCLANSEYCVNK